MVGVVAVGGQRQSILAALLLLLLLLVQLEQEEGELQGRVQMLQHEVIIWVVAVLLLLLPQLEEEALRLQEARLEKEYTFLAPSLVPFPSSVVTYILLFLH